MSSYVVICIFVLIILLVLNKQLSLATAIDTEMSISTPRVIYIKCEVFSS